MMEVAKSKLEQAGNVQAYDISFDLACKTLKDFVKEKGVEVLHPVMSLNKVAGNGSIW